MPLTTKGKVLPQSGNSHAEEAQEACAMRFRPNLSLMRPCRACISRRLGGIRREPALDAPTPPKFRAGATLEQFLADLPYAFALDLHQAFGEPGGRHCVNTPATKRLTAL
jgi:hypothetical protein